MVQGTKIRKVHFFRLQIDDFEEEPGMNSYQIDDVFEEGAFGSMVMLVRVFIFRTCTLVSSDTQFHQSERSTL